jgi:hypothetical protein
LASVRATGARQREKEEDMWLAIAAITLLAAIGFIALAFAVQFEQLVGRAVPVSPIAARAGLRE